MSKRYLFLNMCKTKLQMISLKCALSATFSISAAVIPSFQLLGLKILGVILIPLFLSLPTSNSQANILDIEFNYYLTLFTANSLVHKATIISHF